MPILSTIDTDGYSATNVISATWVITRTGQLLNANSTAFSSTGAVRMTIEGVVAGQTGVEFTTSEGAQSTSPDFVTVTETGLVVGTSTFGYGVSFNDAGSELINAGTIIGWRAVTFASGSNALVSNSGTIQGQATSSTDSIGLRLGGGLVGHIFNSGLIEGDTAILLNGSSATIENSGRILGHGAAGAAVDITTFTVFPLFITLRNLGVIEAAGDAIRAPGAAMEITNLGTIIGDVGLSNWGDVFQGGRGMLLGVLDGGDLDDYLASGVGDDQVLGGAGSDTLRGGAGEDVLEGGLNGDVIRGGEGDDRLLGGAGIDRLDGGTGDDTMTGGEGADRFLFRSGEGGDRIVDFVTGLDRLDLSAFGFASFAQVTGAAHDTGAGLYIDLGSGSVILLGVTEASLTAGDVIL